MALCSQIVDLIGLDLAHQTDQTGGIGQVAIVQGDSVLLNQVVDTSGVGDFIYSNITFSHLSQS